MTVGEFRDHLLRPAAEARRRGLSGVALKADLALPANVVV